MIQKNNLTQAQLQRLYPLIDKFIVESNCQLDRQLVAKSTIQNIVLGLERKAAHDVWILGDIEGYCLCRVDKDADGKMVYTAYQLWLDPMIRDGILVRDFVSYLQDHARESGYARLYVISSRLDAIKAYARGLGRSFRAQSVTFVAEVGCELF